MKGLSTEQNVYKSISRYEHSSRSGNAGVSFPKYGYKHWSY